MLSLCFHFGEVLTKHLTEEQTHSAFPPEHVFGGDDGQQLQDAEAHHCSEAAWLGIEKAFESFLDTFSQVKSDKNKSQKKIFVEVFFPSPFIVGTF